MTEGTSEVETPKKPTRAEVIKMIREEEEAAVKACNAEIEAVLAKHGCAIIGVYTRQVIGNREQEMTGYQIVRVPKQGNGA